VKRALPRGDWIVTSIVSFICISFHSADAARSKLDSCPVCSPVFGLRFCFT
jgi:hypothetical protein